MANSTHSIGFYRLFDAVVANVTQPLYTRMFETWQPGEDSPDGSKQIALDVLQVATSLHTKRGSLTNGQVAFLGDMYDHALARDKREAFSDAKGGATVEEHKNNFSTLAKNHLYWEPPTHSVNLLRGYDALHKTKIANMHKDLLMKIVTVTLTHVEKPTGRDQQILEEFDSLLTEVATATRTPAKRLHPDSGPIITELNKAVLDFIAPAKEVIKSIEELARMDGLKDTETFIRKTFTNYCAQAVLVDSVVDQKELELFHDLAPTLMFFGNYGSVQNLRELFRTATKNISPSEVPMLVSILDVYDQAKGTELGGRARALYFRLANSAFKADMNVDQEELQWLEQFKQTLFPHGTAELLEPVTPQQQSVKPAQNQQLVDTSTVDQSLEELNARIGLDRVKQDVAQLANLIKVQQMRVQKGMPGAAIPKHLVFSGNPGTGQIPVARILANIYRGYGVLTKGQVVEADRASLVVASAGKSEAKVKQVVASAVGGVLFIDDVNGLIQDGDHDQFGQEAVDALVKEIESNRENLVVILSGYSEKMTRLINANSGLKSRFNKFFFFEDYSPEQMLEIFELFCAHASFRTTPSALAHVKGLFDHLYSKRREGFGNARDVRNVFECVIGNQASRIVSLPHVNDEILTTITDEDVLPIVAAIEKPDRQKLEPQGSAQV